jgi:copine 1/2/3
MESPLVSRINASKNFLFFRFFFILKCHDTKITQMTLKIFFKLGENWELRSEMKNVLELNDLNLSYVFHEILVIKLEITFKGQILDEKILTLIDLISTSEQILQFNIGNLSIKSEQIRDNNSAIVIRLSSKISRGFLFWKPHYYFKLWRQVSDTNYAEIYRSENCPGEISNWNQFTLPFNLLGDKLIKIIVYNTSNEIIGENILSIPELLTPGLSFEIKISGKKKGVISILWSELKVNQNFIDHLRNGINIKEIIAIDYTKSNIEYTHPTSNHYITHDKLNPYEASIMNITEILEVYNKDKIIHLYGFGGIPKGRNKISHCFELGIASNTREALDIYRQTLPTIQFSRPTNFNEIILKAQEMCENDQNPMSYYIVLILTDGDLHDYPETSTNIVNSCKYPLSFIIVGIGNADFRSMIQLDSDNEPLKDREGRIAQRDIVQFVPFNKYRDHHGLLASQLLEEVPDQICGYMNSIKKS